MSLFIFLIFSKLFFLYNFFSLTPFHYVYLNLFAGKYSENYKKFENDYWGVSTKKLISNINKNKKIISDSKVKVAVCGLPADIQNNYLKKIKKLKFKIVDKNEDFDYIIMNNRIIWESNSKKINEKQAQTCFEKFIGKDLITIKKRGLVLSKITKI